MPEEIEVLKEMMGDIDTIVIVGNNTRLTSYSPEYTIYVVFEDDGETGYFYAVERKEKEDVILDALHIYDVNDNNSCFITIKWSKDNLQASLMINNMPYAMFNFKSEVGHCMNFLAGVNKYAGKWQRAKIEENK